VTPPQRPTVTQGVSRPVGAVNSGTLLNYGGGVIGSSVSLGGVKPPSDLKPLTASELALKVIPAINGLKAQLEAVIKIGGCVSVLETVVAELRSSQAELTRKVSDLVVKLADTRANVKTLENWVVAMKFTQIPGEVVLLLFLCMLRGLGRPPMWCCPLAV